MDIQAASEDMIVELVESCRIAWCCLRALALSEDGQDVVEYTLLLAFLGLTSAALFSESGGSISGIWSVTYNNLSTATTCATS